MKKTMLKLTTVSLLAVVMLVPGFASAADMKAKVDYSTVTVMQKGGQSWVPLRQIAKSLGYTVMWDKMGKVTLTKSMMMMMEPMKEMDMMDKDMMDKDMMDKDMMDKDMMDKDMMDSDSQPYTVSIMIGKKEFMVGMDNMTFDYAPIVMKNTTYVTKEFVEAYLLDAMTKGM